MERRNKSLVAAVVILIILVLALGGYIVYDKILSTDNINKEDKREETKDENKELDVNSNIVKELDKKYLITGDFYPVDIYYLEDTVNVEKMSNQEKVDYLARIGFVKEGTVNQGNSIETISEEEYNAGYKKLYGPDQKIIQLKEEEANCLIYWFDSTNHMYKRSQGCGYGPGPSHQKYIASASKEGEYISINIKAYYDLSSKTDDSIPVGEKYIIPYNNDFDTSNRNMPVDSFDEKEVNSEYGDYLETHKITFKKASDGEYYFYSTEHLNDEKTY